MYEKAVVVTRRTRLQELVSRFNTPGQAKFYVGQQLENFYVSKKSLSLGEARGRARKAVADYEAEDDAYRPAVESVVRRLSRLDIAVETIDRSLAPTYLFTDKDVVVTLGQDGLVANCAKYASGPIVGVNPDPSRFDGVLLPFGVDDVADAVGALLAGRARERSVTLAEAVLNDGQRLLAFNDIFIGARTHVSARYRIRFGGAEEDHSSSGIVVSTGAGSTGWLSSMFNMAAGLGVGPRPQAPKLRWEDPNLFFVTREPFISRTSAAGIVSGRVSASRPLEVESLMSEGGVIFSDGIEADFLRFDSGALASIRPAERKARLVAR